MIVLVRLGLAILAFSELVVGAWNQFLPESFFRDFPTASLHPPYSEHFARDFGGATLGIAAVLVVAFARPTAELVGVASLAYSVFAVPHFLFHALHLDHATTADALFLLLANGSGVLIGLLLGVWAVRRWLRDRSLRAPAVG